MTPVTALTQSGWGLSTCERGGCGRTVVTRAPHTCTTPQTPHLRRERAQRRQVLDSQHAFLGCEEAAGRGGRVRREVSCGGGLAPRHQLRRRHAHARTAEMLRSSRKASSDVWSSWSLMRKSNGVGLSATERRPERRHSQACRYWVLATIRPQSAPSLRSELTTSDRPKRVRRAGTARGCAATRNGAGMRVVSRSVTCFCSPWALAMALAGRGGRCDTASGRGR